LLRSSHSGVYIARLVSSPYLQGGEEIFRIEKSGIEDVDVSNSENEVDASESENDVDFSD
jgi:hypothetical protein